MIIQGVQDGEVYGADTPLYFSAQALLGESITSVTLLIYVWYGDKVTDEPANPNYRLYRNEDSFGKNATFTEFNISSFAKDVLRFETFSGSYALNNACWMKVEYYINYLDAGQAPQTLDSELTIACTMGYSTYEQEANFLLNPVLFPSSELNATIGSVLPITILANQITGGSSKTITKLMANYSDGSYNEFVVPAVTDNTNNLFQIAEFDITDVDYIDIESDVPAYGSVRVFPKSVYKYKPQRVGYLDSNGTISHITFYGNNIEISNYTRDTFGAYKGSSYDRNNGNTRIFRTNGRESITMNTDWVSEDFFQVIDQLLLSKYVFLEVENLSCGKTYPQVVESDGGTCESAQCVANGLQKYGLTFDDLRTAPTYEVGQRINVIPETKNITQKKLVNELINYQIEFKKAFGKKATYL